MKALLLIFTVLFFFASPSFAVKDIPKNHWASREAETLVERKWIRTFPDKTFRGNTAFTRFEAAMLFGKMMDEFFPRASLHQKIWAELQREKEDIGWELSYAKSSFSARGRVLTGGEVGSAGSDLSSRGHMRVQYDVHWEPNEDRILEVRLDTWDAGWGGGTSRNEIRDFVDWHWTERFFIKNQEISLRAEMGPEDIFQSAPSPSFPEYQDSILLRHNPMVSATTDFLGGEITAGIQAHGVTGTGSSNFQSAFLKMGGMQWVLLPNGSRFQMVLPQIHRMGAAITGELWISNLGIDEGGWALSSLWGDEGRNFAKLQIIQAGDRFRKRPDELIDWLPLSPKGAAALNGTTITVAEWGMDSFLPFALKWNSEWFTSNTNTIQTHRLRLLRQVGQGAQWTIGISFFDSRNGRSWMGTTLSRAQSGSILTGLELDMPSWHF